MTAPCPLPSMKERVTVLQKEHRFYEKWCRVFSSQGHLAMTKTFSTRGFEVRRGCFSSDQDVWNQETERHQGGCRWDRDDALRQLHYGFLNTQGFRTEHLVKARDILPRKMPIQINGLNVPSYFSSFLPTTSQLMNLPVGHHPSRLPLFVLISQPCRTWPDF